ncbi:MAG: hypothetical protein ACYTGS_19060 [Planctomycetota bacterium]|jgi:hypothetical protein
MILVDYPGDLVASLLLAILAVLVFFAFRSGELRNPKLRSYRLPLILLQYASILVLLLILWNPSRAKVSETLSRNSVLALFDTSESMSVVEDGRSTSARPGWCGLQNLWIRQSKLSRRIVGFPATLGLANGSAQCLFNVRQV